MKKHETISEQTSPNYAAFATVNEEQVRNATILEVLNQKLSETAVELGLQIWLKGSTLFIAFPDKRDWEISAHRPPGQRADSLLVLERPVKIKAGGHYTVT